MKPEQGAAGMAVNAVLEWLIDRKDNAERIAKTKTGADRAGWEQDAAYFLAAAKLIADAYPDNKTVQ
jgi:hypothetical protein